MVISYYCVRIIYGFLRIRFEEHDVPIMESSVHQILVSSKRIIIPHISHNCKSNDFTNLIVALCILLVTNIKSEKIRKSYESQIMNNNWHNNKLYIHRIATRPSPLFIIIIAKLCFAYI
jgi:hypothetical protein